MVATARTTMTNLAAATMTTRQPPLCHILRQRPLNLLVTFHRTHTHITHRCHIQLAPAAPQHQSARSFHLPAALLLTPAALLLTPVALLRTPPVSAAPRRTQLVAARLCHTQPEAAPLRRTRPEAARRSLIQAVAAPFHTPDHTLQARALFL